MEFIVKAKNINAFLCNTFCGLWDEKSLYEMVILRNSIHSYECTEIFISSSAVLLNLITTQIIQENTELAPQTEEMDDSSRQCFNS